MGDYLLDHRRPEGNGTIAHLVIVLLAILAILLLIVAVSPHAKAASAICDPQVSSRCLHINPDGSILTPGLSGAETASNTGTTAATTATLAAASGKTTYICGFSIRGDATAAATADATVTGTITGTLHFTQWTAPLASGIGVVEEQFTPCLPASGANQAIAVISAAPGSGGVVSVSAWGYKQ